MLRFIRVPYFGLYSLIGSERSAECPVYPVSKSGEGLGTKTKG